MNKTATETLEDQILAEKAKEISDEIDFHILSEMLQGIGWVKVVLGPMTWEQGYEVDKWITENCHSAVETLGLVWLFENRDEAALFTLTWA